MLRFVFIDEYQDFSELFHRLIEAVRSQNPQALFFCVGDDWQSINGFAGSDLFYYENFDQIFAPARRLYLTTNYRSGGSIVAAGNALMRDRGTPARAHNKRGEGVVAVADLARFEPSLREQEVFPGDVLTPAVIRLAAKCVEEGRDVVLLSRMKRLPWYVSFPRNRGSDSDLNDFLALVLGALPDSDGRISISTVHKYKGLQRAAVIVLDAKARRYPLLHPNLIFTRIFGDSLEGAIDEERRLFYVALTRAADRLFVLTDSADETPFLEDVRRSARVLDWTEYPQPILGGSRMAVVVVDQQNRRGGGTFAIKDFLKAERYEYRTKDRAWRRTWPAEGFSVEGLREKSSWAPLADGVEVRLLDEAGNSLAIYLVNKGKWNKI